MLNSNFVKVSEQIFDPNIVEAISRLKSPNQHLQEKKFWIPNNSGIFSVKSAYKKAAIEEHDIGEDPSWKWLWKTKIHGRHKMLL